MSFLLKMKRSARKVGSNIVLALDFPFDTPQTLFSRSIAMLEMVEPYICALKINRQLILPIGLFDGVQKILNSAHDRGLPVIMDCKINDVGHTNRMIAECYYRAGFDAVTANPFVGWEGGLQPVFEVAQRMGRGVILLVYMSHKGAEEGYGQTILDPEAGRRISQYAAFAKKALSWNSDGAIVGATHPKKIRKVYVILKDRVPIYSPGVGVQGGGIESAMKAGAHYLIVGRAITLAKKPDKAAKTIRDIAHRFLEE